METKYLRNLSKTQKSEKLGNSQHVSQMKENITAGTWEMELSSLLWCTEKSILSSKKSNCDRILLFNTLHLNKEDCLIFLTNNRNKSKLYFWTVWSHVSSPAPGTVPAALPPPFLLLQRPMTSQKAISFLILFSTFRWPLWYSSLIVSKFLWSQVLLPRT